MDQVKSSDAHTGNDVGTFSPVRARRHFLHRRRLLAVSPPWRAHARSCVLRRREGGACASVLMHQVTLAFCLPYSCAPLSRLYYCDGALANRCCRPRLVRAPSRCGYSSVLHARARVTTTRICACTVVCAGYHLQRLPYSTACLHDNAAVMFATPCTNSTTGRS